MLISLPHAMTCLNVLIAYNVHYREEENLLEKCTRLIAFIHPQALPVLDCKRIGNGTVENPPMCTIALGDVGSMERRSWRCSIGNVLKNALNSPMSAFDHPEII